MESTTKRPTGMRAFIVIWIGQILSLLGTSVSQFGMQLWIADKTDVKATPMALMGFFFMLPMVALTPVVGVLVDRSNRKLMMMLSDLAAALTTLITLLLFMSGSLQIWHLYITAFISGVFQGFQWPAYSTAISTMLDKKDYARASAMVEMVGPASNIFAPMIAGAIMAPLGVLVINAFGQGFADSLGTFPGLLPMLAIDLISAAFAVGSLLFVHIPQPERSEAGRQAEGSFLKQAAYGFQYIFARPSLLGLQTVFLLGNFFSAIGFTVWAPMILSKTDKDPLIFGSIQTAAAVGGLAGGLIMSAWGGFKRRSLGVIFGWMLLGIAMIALGMSNSLIPWLIMAALTQLPTPLVNASNQAIWQAKVPPDVQGRVFATRRLIAWAVSPVAQLVSGPLADRIFEPAMQSGGVLRTVFGDLFGSGAGAGMSLQMALAGTFAVLIGIVAYNVKIVRLAEDMLPDHDAASEATETVTTAPVQAD